MNATHWAVMKLGKRKLGVISAKLSHPENVARSMYGKDVYLVLMDRTFTQYYQRSGKNG